MDSHTTAPPPPASLAHYYYPPPHANHSDYDHVCSEKDAYEHHYAPRDARGSKGSSRSRAHDSVLSNPRSPKPSSPPSPSSSISGHHIHSIERQRSPNSELAYPPRAHLELEKVDTETSSHRPRTPRVSASNPDVTAVYYDLGEQNERETEEKTVQLLLFLSGPCALLSLLITLWTFVALLITLLLQPFRLFSSRSTFLTQLTTFLAPTLNLQLHLIYSYSVSTDYSPPMLVVVHLFSPFVAVGVAIAAWTAACFWFFSAILGDPAGQDGHNDGKESILGVRNWWDRWLSRALR